MCLFGSLGAAVDPLPCGGGAARVPSVCMREAGNETAPQQVGVRAVWDVKPVVDCVTAVSVFF
jgi:hypothetical protein